MFFGIFKGRNEYGLSLIIFSFASFFMLSGLSSVNYGKSAYEKPQKKSMMAQVVTPQGGVPYMVSDSEASPPESIQFQAIPRRIIRLPALPPLPAGPLPDVLPQEPGLQAAGAGAFIPQAISVRDIPLPALPPLPAGSLLDILPQEPGLQAAGAGAFIPQAISVRDIPLPALPPLPAGPLLDILPQEPGLQAAGAGAFIPQAISVRDIPLPAFPPLPAGSLLDILPQEPGLQAAGAGAFIPQAISVRDIPLPAFPPLPAGSLLDILPQEPGLQAAGAGAFIPQAISVRDIPLPALPPLPAEPLPDVILQMPAPQVVASEDAGASAPQSIVVPAVPPRVVEASGTSVHKSIVVPAFLFPVFISEAFGAQVVAPIVPGPEACGRNERLTIIRQAGPPIVPESETSGNPIIIIPAAPLPEGPPRVAGASAFQELVPVVTPPPRIPFDVVGAAETAVHPNHQLMNDSNVAASSYCAEELE